MTLNDLIKIIFENKSQWGKVSNEDKEKLFFIFNRLMSYDFPEMSQSLNHKNISTIAGMDAWFYFLMNKKYKWKWKDKKQSIEETIKKDSGLSTFELNLVKTYYKEDYEKFIKKSKFKNVG